MNPWQRRNIWRMAKTNISEETVQGKGTMKRTRKTRKRSWKMTQMKRSKMKRTWRERMLMRRGGMTWRTTAGRKWIKKETWQTKYRLLKEKQLQSQKRGWIVLQEALYPKQRKLE